MTCVKPRAARVRRLLERHPAPAILALRFLYGLRIVGPIALGMSAVPWTRFAALHLIGALAWATLLGSAGYLFGGGLQLLLGDLRELELALAAGIVVLGGVLWWLRLRRRW
ncbi:MAG: VTT domain-containing protein [Betaproteobacteria bacterium]|nr:VTT domain-containing protein [Betaproteobacteria bacterium]